VFVLSKPHLLEPLFSRADPGGIHEFRSNDPQQCILVMQNECLSLTIQHGLPFPRGSLFWKC
jgi:hypothetical protein